MLSNFFKVAKSLKKPNRGRVSGKCLTVKLFFHLIPELTIDTSDPTGEDHKGGAIRAFRGCHLSKKGVPSEYTERCHFVTTTGLSSVTPSELQKPGHFRCDVLMRG